eukprot:g3997.t1
MLNSLVTAEEGNCHTQLAAAVTERDTLVVKLKKFQDSFQTLQSEKASAEEQVSNFKDEIESFKLRLKTAEETVDSTKHELEAARAQCDITEFLKCKDELKIASGASKQLEVELGNSFARVEVLAAEIKQLNNLVQQLEGKLKTSQQELSRMKEDLERTNTASVFLQFTQFLELQLVKFSPYWMAIKESFLSIMESLLTHPVIQEAVEVIIRVIYKAKEVLIGIYKEAEPHLSSVYKVGKQYGQIAFAKANGIYVLVKPVINRGIQFTKDVTFQSARVAKTHSVQFATIIREKSIEFYESQLVADVKKQSVETIAEIENYVRYHMEQIPALQPFAKSQYALFVVYTLLSLPVLVIVMILMSYCGGSSAKEAADSRTAAGKKTKTAAKKSKRTRHA